jgi:hypothetical protein
VRLEAVDQGIIDLDIMASLSELKMSITMGVEPDIRRDAVRLFPPM